MNLTPRRLNKYLIYLISEKTEQDFECTETLLKDKFGYYYIVDSYDKESAELNLKNYVKVYITLDCMTDEQVKQFNLQISKFALEKNLYNLEFLRKEHNNEHQLQNKKFNIKNLI